MVAAAAVAEALNALGVLDNGTVPGADYRFRGFLVVGAGSTLLLVALCAAIITVSRRLAYVGKTPTTIVFLVAAACLCVARFYAYDSYYAPTRIRFGGSDTFSPSFVIAAVALDLAAASLLYRWPRLAFALLFPGLMMSAVFVFAAASRH